MLNAIRTLFELRGFLSGYKTYITAFAGILAVVAQFFTGAVIPFIDGDLSLLALATDSLPVFVEQITPFVAIGTLRAGVETSS
jgi:hypothetical protein